MKSEKISSYNKSEKSFASLLKMEGCMGNCVNGFVVKGEQEAVPIWAQD
jgi:hypothetical protein